MILFLDDDRTRHRYFTLTHIGRLVTHAWTAEQAIRALAAGEHIHNSASIVEVWLDHDLAYEHYGNAPALFSTGTGQQVARWLAESEYPRDIHIILHSLNPVGAAAMEATLLEAGFVNTCRQPFKIDYEIAAGVA